MGDNGYRGEGWFWKPMTIVLMTSLITGTGFFIKDSLTKQNWITRAEAQSMIELEAPYVKDRKYILATLDKIQSDVDFIKQHFWKATE